MDNKELATKVEALEGIVTDQSAKIKAQYAEIAALKAGTDKESVAKKVEQKPALKTPTQTFEVEKVKYKFMVPSFRIHVGPVLEKIVSAEAIKDGEMLQRLVEEKRFGIIAKA